MARKRDPPPAGPNRWARRAALGAALLLGISCLKASADSPAPSTFPARIDIVERIYDAKIGLGRGWLDYGWAASRQFGPGKPATIDFSRYGGWIIAHPDLKGTFGGLTFRFRGPVDASEFLEVRVDSSRAEVFPRVQIQKSHGRPAADGWTEYFVPMSELDPQRARFEQVVFRARANVAAANTQFDAIGLTAPTKQPPKPMAPAKEAKMVIDCLAPTHPINPMIYGVAYAFASPNDTTAWELGAGARRWGGNPASRYNWELGNAWNTASDWFFRNVNYTGDPRYRYDAFLDDDVAHKVPSALTVPTIGWVARDTRSVSFPTSIYGAQQQVAPEDPEAGNGVGRDGKPIPPGPPTRTSVVSTPESIGKWVRAVREGDRARGHRRVAMYILDNEPTLWNSTHRDVHPDPVTYDELLQRMVEYATAIREADPDAVIAGPAEWGWLGLQYSALDMAAGGARARPDRLAHGNMALAPWLLRRIREQENRTGRKLLDVFDVHFYPAAKNIGMGPAGGTDAATAARRIRSPRSLWDASYRDESWIEEPLRLIPQLKEWIAENAPGVGISIGEYNFGAEDHMSGALALAEALGRFGSLGITSAFYWTYPAPHSAAGWAFRAYRNYDGHGAKFASESLQTRSFNPAGSLFAAKDSAAGRITAVLLNLDSSTPLDARIDVSTCPSIEVKRAFTYSGGEEGFTAAPGHPELPGRVVSQILPPWSIVVLEMQAKQN